MIIGITGHTNIEKIKNKISLQNGKIYDKEVYEEIYIEIENCIKKISQYYNTPFEDLTLVSGMARGIDEIFAEIAYRNNLNLIMSIPHSIEWHKTRGLSRGMKSQALEYDKLLNYSKTIKKNEVKKIYGGKTYLFANFARNQNIIDESEIVISYKSYESAGTNDAIATAKHNKKYLGNVTEINNNEINFSLFEYKSKKLEEKEKKRELKEIQEKESFKYLKEDICNGTEKEQLNKIMIIQGCNSLGKMGAGIADYLKLKFPKQANEYQEYYKENGLNIGEVIFSIEKKNLYIGNIISQENIGRDKQYVDYRSLYEGLKKVKTFCIKNNIKLIKTPLIGTGLAGGEWGVIENLYKDVFKDSEIIIEYYEINDSHLVKTQKILEERNLIRKKFNRKNFPENFNFDSLKFLNNNALNAKINLYNKNNDIKIDNNVIDLEKYKIKLINIGNIKKDNITYIGRPSLWQNPFPTKKSKFSPNVYPHEESLRKYKEETLSKLKVKNFVKSLKENGEIILSCFCVDKIIDINNYKIDKKINCHGEILAEKIFEELINDLKNENLNNIKEELEFKNN